MFDVSELMQRVVEARDDKSSDHTMIVGVDISPTGTGVVVLTLDGEVVHQSCIGNRMSSAVGRKAQEAWVTRVHDIVTHIMRVCAKYPGLVCLHRWSVHARKGVEEIRGALLLQLWLSKGATPIIVPASVSIQRILGYGSNKDRRQKVEALGYDFEDLARADAFLAAEWYRRLMIKHRDFFEETDND